MYHEFNYLKNNNYKNLWKYNFYMLLVDALTLLCHALLFHQTS